MVKEQKDTKQIVIAPITRIEGHAQVTIFLNDDDAVRDARFKLLILEVSRNSLKADHSTKCPVSLQEPAAFVL